jgi:diacylglycerol kinase family enzyme
MRKASLLYNPVSGGGRRRRGVLEEALACLRSGGVEAEVILTRSSVDAEEQARGALAAGCDTIFACGGDGTIHDLIQGMAGSGAALAILPMGTANALAHDLRLPLHPVAAARAALAGAPRRIALGQITYRDFQGHSATRYFTVAAGAGVDAHLFYKLNPSVKNRLGMAAYYAKAWRLWMTHRMVRFQATWTDPASGTACSASLTELLAVRIANFGGILRELAPGASLLRDDVRVLMCHTSSRAAYLNYVTRCMLGLPRNVQGVEIVASGSISCDYAEPENSAPANFSKVFVQADGELLGTLPATITVVPDALTLLVPQTS